MEALLTEWLTEWWSVTTATYELIWPALPFAAAYGLWRGYSRTRRGRRRG